MKTSIELEELRILEPADGRSAIAIVVAALMTDLAVRSGVAVLSGTLLVVAVAAGMLLSGRLHTTQSRIAVALAPMFGLFLTLRQSPWLLLPDIAVAAGLLTVGAVLARDGGFRSLTGPQLVLRAIAAFVHGLLGPAFAWQALRSRDGTSRSRAVPILRGLALAVPLVALLGLLLASADAVFASWFHITLDVESMIEHVLLIVIGMWGMAGLLRTSSCVLLEVPDVAPRLGRTEAVLLLVALDVLFGLFALAQLVALSRAGERILHTRGLTYSQYAHSGFFQLLAVAAITLAVLAAVRALTDRTPAIVVLAVAAIAGTLGVVVVAVNRLALYEQAYGHTMLRMYSKWFAIWIGVAFICLALAVVRDATWFVPAALGAGLAVLLALNVLNPEALVARRNFDRVGRFDPAYIARLGPDAAPEVARHLDRVPDATLHQMCGSSNRSWASYNRARAVCDRLQAQTRRDVGQ